MDYGMIGKIEKARRYAEEPERVTFDTLEAEFRGDNSGYQISLNQSGWNCTCPGFQTHRICPHIMAMERLFKPLLKRDPVPYAPGQNVVSDVEKAKRYSEERNRIRITNFDVTFQGTNSSHRISHNQGSWDCTCDFFKSRNVCCHTMALERIMVGMLPVAAADAAVETTP